MTEASESAALVLRMKRELIDLVKSEDYASALLVCNKLAAVVPQDALVDQYRRVLGEKVALDEANAEDVFEDDERSDFTAGEDDASGEEEESEDASSEETDETRETSSDAHDDERVN